MSARDTARVRTCHAPVTIHAQVPTGVNKCPLSHWEGCSGGIVEGKAANGSEWLGCPADFIAGAPGVDFDKSDSSDDGRDTFEETLEEVEGDDRVFTEESLGLAFAASKLGSQEPSQAEVQVTVEDVPSEDATVTEARELMELQARNRLLKEQFARHEAEKVEQEKQERARMIKLIQAENERLVADMGGDTGGARQRHTLASAGNVASSNMQASKSLPRLGTEQTNPASGTWHSSFQQHLTKNQIRAAQSQPTETPIYRGLDMNGIRKIPHLKYPVENLVEQSQGRVPSLDRRPSAPFGQPLPPPSLPASKPTFAHTAQIRNGAHPMTGSKLGSSLPSNRLLSNKMEDDFLYLRREDGSIYKVPVLNEKQVIDLSPPPQPTRSDRFQSRNNGQMVADTEDVETSSDEDCPLVPKQGWRHVWRRLPNGDKYFTEEPVSEHSSEMEYKWIKDAVTGRTTKQLVMKEQQSPEMDLRLVIDPTTGNQVQMWVPRTPTRQQSTPITTKPKNKKKPANDHPPTHVDYRLQSGLSTSLPPVTTTQPRLLTSQTLQERVPSYITPTDEKQGKDSRIPAIVQYARDCPVAWTSKVTSDKLNMGLWCWASVAELLASRTGLAPALAPGELEARMQHLLNVLEIALQPSNPTEYDGQSWKVARLYAEKVQQKVDKGSSWVAFEHKYGADTHPHELMAAQNELAPKVVKYKQLEKGGGEKGGGEKVGREKRICTTWNTSTVEHKCKFEVENTGRECDRKHECSWCKDKHKKSLPHQRSFCRQRLAAGEQ